MEVQTFAAIGARACVLMSSFFVSNNLRILRPLAIPPHGPLLQLAASNTIRLTAIPVLCHARTYRHLLFVGSAFINTHTAYSTLSLHPIALLDHQAAS